MSPAYGRMVESTFRAHPLLRNCHLQTSLPALLRPLPRLVIRKERLELPDGDFVDLGWAGTAPRGSPIAVLVHGLTGGFESKYLRGTAGRLIELGWRVAILQLRGAGAEPNRLTRCYHQGQTDDLRYLWHLLARREPGVHLASLGWSLGANLTLKALAEEGDQAPVVRAAVACAPFRLEPCAEKLRTGFARQYQNRLLRDLKAQVIRKHAAVDLSSHIVMTAVLGAADFFAYDDAYTAPLNGFRNARDYYRRSECGQFLGDIKRPTLIVNAADDPFMPTSSLPAASELAPPVTLEVSRRGGHVGFIAADSYLRPSMWLERRLADWIGSA